MAARWFASTRECGPWCDSDRVRLFFCDSDSDRELLAKRNFRKTYEEFDRGRKRNEKSQKSPPRSTLQEERDRMLEARWKYIDAAHDEDVTDVRDLQNILDRLSSFHDG